MRLITKATKAFSLLELIIVMAVISIIMGAAAPGVDKWVARYRAQAFISTLVSDFAEAKILATAGGSHRNSTSATSSDPFNTAIRFTPTEYQIITRSFAPVGNISWDPALANNALVKRVPYPRGVVVNDIRSTFNSGTAPITTSDSVEVKPAYIFLSTGIMQNGVSKKTLTAKSADFCGSGRTLPPATMSVNVIANQDLSETQAFYRVNLNPDGTYGVCYTPDGSSFYAKGQFMNSF